ncbi:MAG: multicopper oxidase domain-containing protein [Gemmatimonadales bacterium]|nr:multicopper oxidase domain-containing protein [Gemmatimonadales bacterium]
MFRLAPALLAGLALLPSNGAPASPPPLAVVAFNDNVVPAGRKVSGEWRLELEIQRAEWFPLGPDKGSGKLFAFAERGEAPSIPGPMLRVPQGTPVRVSVTNTTDSTLVVHGLSSKQQAVPDSLVLAPGATGEARFIADAAGTFYYWAAIQGTAFADRMYEDSQLSGAFVVDSPGSKKSAADRVFVISWWVMAKTPGGDPDLAQEIFAINGRPWPNTERLRYTMGDSVSWRVINASADPHPMHLHGFYFRVDSRGDAARDTVYWPNQRRMAVTELAQPGTTMRIAFQPDRPGGWVFHCHLNWHVVANAGIGEFMQPTPEREASLFSPHAAHDPDNHVERGMGGLMMGITIVPPPGYAPAKVARRTLRLHVNEQQGPLPAGQANPRFAYVLEDGGTPPAPDSLRSPGSTLLLTRDEPTLIRVFNHGSQPTQVHWHGLELESPFDGVVGVGGMPGMPTPAIMPGDSFDVHITPPRSGTFMYHTHMDEVLQHSGGLWGALLILEPGQQYDAEHDLTFQIGEAPDLGPTLNGTSNHAERTLQASTDYRFRLMNISMGGPNLEYWLVKDGAPTLWKPLAKDGFDLPRFQQQKESAKQRVSIGETFDVEVNLTAGNYALEVRGGRGNLVTKVPIKVVAWQQPAEQVASAVLPLPEELRSGATVLGYQALDTPLVTLKQGDNGMICLADDPMLPAFHVACYHEGMEPFMARGRALRASGVTGDGVDSVRYAEVEAGTLSMPERAALWQLTGAPGSFDAATNTIKAARPLYVVYLPFATSATTGLPSVPAVGESWLMFPGTPKAHIMFVPRM